MGILEHPDVIRAKAIFDAASKASAEAEKGYVSAVLRAAGNREAAFAALGWPRRTGFRRLAELGLSNVADPSPEPPKRRGR